jgi:hypothetical protein
VTDEKVNAYTCDEHNNAKQCYCIGPENCKDTDCGIVKAWRREMDAVAKERKLT